MTTLGTSATYNLALTNTNTPLNKVATLNTQLSQDLLLLPELDEPHTLLPLELPPRNL